MFIHVKVLTLFQLTNTLQKKLNQVRREKAELERQIEKEHMAKAKLKSMHSIKEDSSLKEEGTGGEDNANTDVIMN